MNSNLWIQVSTFDLDEPVSEYGFSTRLAWENQWTADFTQKAILEYKKFMYLAGTSGEMVSPSPIVDLVWHQHLLFSESYTALCTLIGKSIKHVPSTHNQTDAAKFKQAAEQTEKLYLQEFGEQPPGIWTDKSHFDSLHLPRAKWDVATFSQLSVLAFIVLVFPAYFLLKPLYIHLNNPGFLYGYGAIFALVMIFLYNYNQDGLRKIVNSFAATAYVRHLCPAELVYLKTQDLSSVIHGCVDRLIKDEKIVVNRDQTLQLAAGIQAATAAEATIFQAINTGRITYPVLLKILVRKPVFTTIANSMDAFRSFFIRSKDFGSLYYRNVYILLFMLMLGVVRLLTGLVRQKPVVLIFLMVFLGVIAVAVFLRNLTNLFCTSTLTELYRTEIFRASQHGTAPAAWEYFLYGTVVLSPVFIPVVVLAGDSGGSADGGGGGGDGGGGSSCGSSCGGCGGGD
ncbi:MAG: hypothetical protein INR73_08540 [Williamsia sp.]|nr:hypothetical protein [Williamsia sp.]